MTFLLDVNVLIALVDPMHVQHNAAHDWFAKQGKKSWATCPLTENGVIRIVGHIRYPNSPGTPAEVAQLMESLCALPGHVFWQEDFSLVDSERVDAADITTPSQVTDTYLLALAVAKGGQLATFDRRLSTKAVRGGRAGLHVIDG